MEDIKNWLEQYRRTVEAAFGERILLFGAAGQPGQRRSGA